jgi:hypothetical protein
VLGVLFPRPNNEDLVGVKCDAGAPSQDDPLHPKALALDQVDDRKAGYDRQEYAEMALEAIDCLITLTFHGVLEEVIHREAS